MVTKRTGRQRGRPKIILKDDPNRYLLAFFEAQCRICTEYKDADSFHMSRRKLALTLMAWLHGEFVDDEENWKNMRKLNPVRFTTNRTTGGFAENPRNPTYFHVEAETFCRKVHKLNTEDPKSAQGQLWNSLVQSWIGTLIEIPSDKGSLFLRMVQALCEGVGEGNFYRQTLAPWNEAKLAGRPIPEFSLPDFFLHDAT